MRVSDNTSRHAVHDALGRTRARIEDLQLKNATLKKLNAPSDDPAANAKIMDIRTQSSVNKQFDMNANTAKDRLQHTENAVQELTDILLRAKEIALNQSSGASATPESRAGVAQEVAQLYKQVVAIANRRIGDHYIFGGFKTLTPPYGIDGSYRGDLGEMPLEIQKGVNVSSNIPGPSVFKAKRYLSEDLPNAILQEDIRESAQESPFAPNVPPPRGPASEKSKDGSGQIVPTAQQVQPSETIDLFKTIEMLRVGLLTNDTHTIRGTLEAIDALTENTISIRSKIGSRIMGIDAALGATDRTNLQNAMVQSNLEDADYAELWSSLAKEESVLRASLSAAQKLIQPTLLEFMR
jgi:flagellar hook-associated protein 3 FlgL